MEIISKIVEFFIAVFATLTPLSGVVLISILALAVAILALVIVGKISLKSMEERKNGKL